jgi:hypothetical protein
MQNLNVIARFKRPKLWMQNLNVIARFKRPKFWMQNLNVIARFKRPKPDIGQLHHRRRGTDRSENLGVEGPIILK